jgi:hypothetical protein
VDVPGRKRYGPVRRVLLPGSLLALIALLSLPMSAVPAFASPTVVQTGGGFCTAAPCSTASVITTSAIGVNNVLVVSVQTFVSTSAVCSTQSTISDTAGNVWTKQTTNSAPAVALGKCVFSAISTSPITTGGADTITVTVSGPAFWIGIQYQEVSGVSTTGIVLSSGTDQKTSCVAPLLTSYSLTSKSFNSGSVLIGSYSTDFLVIYGAPTAGSTFTTQADGHVFEAFDEYSTTASSPNTWAASNLGGVCLWAGVGIALFPPPAQVPQFPLGVTLLLALILPGIILLRLRIFRSVTT